MENGHIRLGIKMDKKDFEVGDWVKVLRWDEFEIGQGIIRKIEEEKHATVTVNRYVVELHNVLGVSLDDYEKVYRYALRHIEHMQ